MPTTSIIGYLWSQRQDLGLRTTVDALQMATDLASAGVPVCTLTDEKILGVMTGHAYVHLAQREPEEWAEIVEKAIMDSAVADTISMLHEERDFE